MTDTIRIHKVSYETKEMTIKLAKTVKALRLVSMDKMLNVRYENNTEENICIPESRSDEWERFLSVAKQAIPSIYFTHSWAKAVTKITWKEVIKMDGVNYTFFTVNQTRDF